MLNFPAEDEQGVRQVNFPAEDEQHSKWIARIYHSGKRHYLGGFDNEENKSHHDNTAMLDFPV
jgi:hypothetical protein